MAEAAAGEQLHRQRKFGGVLLTCFCASACSKEQLQLAPEEEDEISSRRRNGPSTTINERPLLKIADAFKELANVISSGDRSDVEVAAFSRACSFVTPLFGSIGFNFKFIEMDYVTKVLYNISDPLLLIFLFFFTMDVCLSVCTTYANVYKSFSFIIISVHTHAG